MTSNGKCIIIDCEEEGVIEIYNEALNQVALICKTHVKFINSEEE